MLDRMKQEVKRNKELIDRDSDLPHEDELYNKLARAANSITAKDNLIQVRVGIGNPTLLLFIKRCSKCNYYSVSLSIFCLFSVSLSSLQCSNTIV